MPSFGGIVPTDRLPGTNDVRVETPASRLVQGRGLAVAIAPKFGGWLVAAWLGGTIVNLLTFSGFRDVALRDVGRLVAAVALAHLARPPPGAGP